MKNLSQSDVVARDEVVRLIKKGEPTTSALKVVINKCNDDGRRKHLWAVLPQAIKDVPRKKKPVLLVVGQDIPINSKTIVTPRMLDEARAVEVLHNNGQEIMEEFLAGDIELLNEIAMDGEIH